MSVGRCGEMKLSVHYFADSSDSDTIRLLYATAGTLHSCYPQKSPASLLHFHLPFSLTLKKIKASLNINPTSFCACVLLASAESHYMIYCSFHDNSWLNVIIITPSAMYALIKDRYDVKTSSVIYFIIYFKQLYCLHYAILYDYVTKNYIHFSLEKFLPCRGRAAT